MSDEDTLTTLAYSKSPKFSKRTTFQEELQEALFARAARQNSGYLDDFESDEEGMIKELLEDRESIPKKSLAFTIPLFNHNLDNVGTLQSGSADDLASPYIDKRPQQVAMLNMEISDEERQAVPFSLNENSGSYERSETPASISFEMSPSDDYSWKSEAVDNMTLSEDNEITLATCMLQSKNLSEERQENDSELLVSEEELEVGGDHDQQNKASMTELQMERSDVPHKPEIKPLPKPREFKTKTASASAENVSIPVLDEYSKPSPQPRSVLRKRSHLEYSKGSKGPRLARSSSRFPIHFSPLDEKTGDFNEIISEEESSKDQEYKEPDDYSDMQASGRESPSVLELMLTAAYEVAGKPSNLHKRWLERKLQMSERRTTERGSYRTATVNKSERKRMLNTSKEKVEERAPQKTKPSDRPFRSTYLKKTGKPSSISLNTSSQYLGTLNDLDSQNLQKCSSELDKADSLREAVYQDWLEKKRIFMLELHRIRRKRVEAWQENNEKREAAKRAQALASFEAWKAMKEKEAKKLAEKKKLAEEQKKIEEELKKKKKEDAQKAFEKWKEKKAEILKQQIEKEKAERLRKKKEEEAVAEKKKGNRSAFEKWNEKKEELMKQKKKEENQGRKKGIEEQFKTEEKNKKALEEYEKWLHAALSLEPLSALHEHSPACLQLELLWEMRTSSQLELPHTHTKTKKAQREPGWAGPARARLPPLSQHTGSLLAAHLCAGAHPLKNSGITCFSKLLL